MNTEFQGSVISIKNLSGVTIVKNKFVSSSGVLFSSEEDNNRCLGVITADTDNNEMMPVKITGVALVLSGGVITSGDKVSTDGGPAYSITFDDPPTTAQLQKVCGLALDDASGAGELIRVKL